MRWLPFWQPPSLNDDDWTDQPALGTYYQWGAGVLGPVLLIISGIASIVTQQAKLGRWHPLVLTGWNAIALGLAGVSAGMFLHCHYFWGNIYNQAWPAVLGKIIGAIGFIVGMVFVLIRNGILGIH